MAKTIIWNRKASNRFNNIIEYLQSEWGDKVTQNFVIKTYQIIEILAQNPEIGTIENQEKQIRAFVITKHNTIFYRVDDNKLFILTFFDNRQNPNKRSDF